MINDHPDWSGLLGGAVRCCLDRPDAPLTDWQDAPLQHAAAVETTGGLFRISGHAGGLPFSVVLKVVLRPGEDCLDPQELCYWRREALAYQTSLLADLPGGVRSPRCFGVNEWDDRAWIWMEEIPGVGQAGWSLSDFQRAARQLGRFAGAYRTGQPVPDLPWLCASLFDSFYAGDGWWARFIDPDSPKNAWQVPIIQQVFDVHLRAQVLRLWAEKEDFLSANRRLPHVLCHNDAHHRNLALRKNEEGPVELTVIDWAFCGPGGLGNDLGQLVGTSLSYFAVDPAQAADLERAVLDGYQAGLRDAGCDGEEPLARLGYLLSLSLYWGGTLAHEVSMHQPGTARVDTFAKYGLPLEALLPGWTRLAGFALDRADEARAWLRRKR
ncbi:MAG: phosphotransferase [Anaerolineae bacterium]|nr:phosphotransferase [Anaerolineae bacterium]